MCAQKSFNVESFCERFKDAARRARFKMQVYGAVDGYPLLAFQRSADTGPAAIRIYISAGTHGDEPAGSLALLRMMRERTFAPEVDWSILPLLNPAGMALGTRENADGIDLNRDYHYFRTYESSRHRAWLQEHSPAAGFDFALHLHEDWEGEGFYCYELRHDPTPSIAPVILESASAILPLDQRTEIDGRPARGGLIAPIQMEGLDPDREGDLPGAEAIHIFRHHSRLNYTLETPSSTYLDNRVLAHRAAVQAAIQAALDWNPSSEHTP